MIEDWESIILCGPIFWVQIDLHALRNQNEMPIFYWSEIGLDMII